ncbi:MAG: ornithine carbamoyltransferase, partial [Planktomarina sp.]|nr:ornithine carbamoyltransferase [Planktomarina sp.]
MKNFLDINKLEAEELCSILDEAGRIKAGRKGLTQGVPDPKPALSGQIVALIFEKPSTRTRISFDVGVRQMGGSSIVISGSEMQLGHGETISDT